MSVTVASFQVAFPEFANIESALIQARLTMAGQYVSSVLFGASYDDALMLKAADLIATSPLGEQARLMLSDRSSTIYGAQFDQLKRSCASGYRVL